MMRHAYCLIVPMLSAAVAQADWPTYRADVSRSGYTAERLPGRLQLRWVYRPAHAPLPAWPDPGWEASRMVFDRCFHVVAAEGLVFFGSSADGSVYALEAATGKEKWRFATGGPVRFVPAYADGRLFAVSDDGFLYCLKAKDGALLWRKRGGLDNRRMIGNDHVISFWPARGAPAVDDGIVYWAAGIFPAHGVYIYATDAKTGDTVWLNDATLRSGPQGYCCLNSTTLVIPNGRKFPSIFEPSDGRERVRTPTGNPTRVGGANTVVTDRFIFNAEVAYYTKDMKAKAANMGNRLSKQRDREIVVSPTHLYIADGRRIQAADRKALFEGKFRFEKSNPYFDFYRLPGHHGSEKLAVKYVWDDPVKVDCGGALIMAGGTLYAGGTKVVSAADASTRKITWTAETDGLVYGLAAAEGRLFACTDTGSIYCFGTGGGGKAVEQKLPGSAVRDDPAAARAAGEIVRSSSVTKGYCLDLGCGDGKLALALARRTALHIFAVDTDPKKVEAARETIFEAGLLGSRVQVEHVEDLSKSGCPDWSMNLVVSGRSLKEGGSVAPASEAARVQRPHGGVTIFGRPGAMRKNVRGPLEGEGLWTHQYADTGNTSCSGDRIAGTPLCVRWFGGPSSKGMPHAWGRAPAPLYSLGRMYVMAAHFIRCRDAYNGHVVWQTEIKDIGRPYSGGHYSGTYTIGSNWCLSGEKLFVHNRKECLRINGATGYVEKRLPIPNAGGGAWGFIAHRDGVLFGTEEGPVYHMTGMHQIYRRQRTQGKRLFAMNGDTGREIWSHKPEHTVIRDSIAIGKKRVFFIDGIAPDSVPANKQKTLPQPTIVALDVKTGGVSWRSKDRAFGTMLALSEEHDALLNAYLGQNMRGLKSDLGSGMAAYRASTGKKLWADEDMPYNLRPVIVGRTVISQFSQRRSKAFTPCGWDLLTGEPKTRRNPISGNEELWTFGNLIRCGLLATSENLMVYRAWQTVAVDLVRDHGFTIVPGFRVGCWLSVIPAGGMVLLPNNVPNCYCSFMHRTAMGLASEDIEERWGLFNAKAPRKGTLSHLGLNFGAPGDRRDEDGTLWLAMPRPYSRHEQQSFGKLLYPRDAITLKGGATFRRNADRVAQSGTEVPWIAASGLRGGSSVSVDVSKMPADTRYRLKLVFAEPESKRPGERVFDVTVNGRPLLRNLDVVREARRPLVAITKEFTIQAGGKLEVTLVPRKGDPILCGIEIEPRK